MLAGGLDVIYPPEHKELHQEIGKIGCLISEMPPGFNPRGKDFPRRNRIIAGISLGVLVVEAARRSGTLITARMAAEQGREVFAVPGHPLDPRAEGTNHLLKTGATIATCPHDVVETLSPIFGAAINTTSSFQFQQAPVAREPQSTAPTPPPLGPQPAISGNERALVSEALGPAPISIDEIARSTNLPIRTIQVIVMEMDLAGTIERHGHQLVSLRPLIEE